MSDSPIHRIPSIAQLMELRPLKDLAHKVSSGAVAAGIRTYLEPYQKMAMEAAPTLPYTSLQGLASEISHWILGKKGQGRPEVINATGHVLGRDFPMGPISEEVVLQAHVRRHEYRLAAAATGFRHEVERLVCELTGAESAIIFKDRDAAIYLLAQHLADFETFVPRAQMSATFDGINLPKILGEVGGVHEIGASNEVDFAELRTALQDKPARLLWLDRSNFDGPGSAAIPATEKAIEALRGGKSECWVDLGIAGLLPDETHAMFSLTSARQAIEAGADVVQVGGGFLLGGPDCAIVLGRKEPLALLRQMALASHLKAGDAALVEMEACLRIHQSGERVDDRLPLLSLLSTPIENLDLRATRLVEQLEISPWIEEATSRPAETLPLPGGVKLATRQVVLQLSEEGREEALEHLRSFPAVAWLDEAEGEIVLDMRTIFPRQDSELVAKFVPEDGPCEGSGVESGEK
ncbi:hypothetical protein [Blastopirellula marina]|uniref:L-seryl-tRNA(Sec) selenium transferase n=1 Tax=Blastopirellula marina TaxID=124 RepID=A0A2S8GUP9_9BACT|nr:hypothetical protein [Blastopirellula marina]PQO48140.1 hypothetical protein C5Y93_00215 [Blastopirellula marina]